MISRKNIILFAVIVPIVCIVLDQISKAWVLEFFNSNYNIPKDVCTDAGFRGYVHEVSRPFDLTLACNRGVSFGMFGGESELKRWILSGFALAVSAFLVYMIATSKDRLTALSFGLIIGGSLGNVIDRVRFGAVVDFFDFTGIKFPGIFNVADSFITMGVIGMLLAAFFIKETPETPG